MPTRIVAVASKKTGSVVFTDMLITRGASTPLVFTLGVELRKRLRSGETSHQPILSRGAAHHLAEGMCEMALIIEAAHHRNVTDVPSHRMEQSCSSQYAPLADELRDRFAEEPAKFER